MLEILKAIIYGIVQGFTEWLPISSTGHLILVKEFLPLNVFDDVLKNQEFFNMFKVVIQFGSILAVVILYFKNLCPIGFNKTKKQTLDTLKLWLLIIVGCIPVGIAGIILNDYVDAISENIAVIAATLILYGLIFIVIERKTLKIKIAKSKDLKIIDALKIGFFQILALIPGTSRSGVTIIGSRLLGASKQVAAKFSFFVAIPVMFGASLLKLIKLKTAFTLFSFSILAIGTFVSFIVSLIVIKMFMNYIRKHNFSAFGYYRIILGIILIIYVVVK